MMTEKSTDQSVAPSKPSLARQAAPWVFAAAILGYMFYAVDFGEVWKTLKSAKGEWIVGAYLVYCAVYYLTDVLSFHRTYRRMGIAIAPAETTRLRFASYAVQAVNGAVTEIMTVLYMHRVKKTPISHATSAAGFIYFNETLTLIALLTYCAFWLPAENRLPYWSVLQGLVIAAWVLTPVWIAFWSTGLKDLAPRVRDAGAMAAFREARVRDYGEVFFYRFSNNLISVGANVVMLKALGVDAPLPLMFAAAPIMVNAAYWPVSAGGFGGPQAAAAILLKGQASDGAIAAYSLIWSALFFLTRTATGIGFIRPVYRTAFPGRAAPAEIELDKEG